LGFDQAAFEKKMNDPQIASQIRQDIRDGARAGVRGTPTIFINGRRLKNRSPQGFQAAVDKELQRLGKKTGG
jgi:protein-disulfide isomerase